MPIFEYVCEDCRNRFEKIVFGGEKVKCPACDGAKLEKQLSVFAAGTGGGAQRFEPAPAGACGSCGDPRGPGSCSLN